MAERRIVSQERRFIYVPGDVDQDTPVVLRCTARVRGDGTRVRAGTTAESSVEETFTVTRVLRDLATPAFAIDVPEQILEGATHTIAAVLVPGVTTDGIGEGAKIRRIATDGSGAIISVDWLRRGVCYSVGDTLTFTQGAITATYTVTAVNEIGALEPVAGTAIGSGFNPNPIGGDYDTITYAWSIVSGGGNIVGSSTGRSIQYQHPGASGNIAIEVRCVATVAGTGAAGQPGQVTAGRNTASQNANFVVTDHIDTVAPTLTLTDIDFLVRGGTATFVAIPSGGTYDSISYAWRVVSGGGTIGATSGIYDSTGVAGGTTVTIECTATARGEGTNSDPQTTDTVTAQETFDISAIPPADAPTLTLTDITALREGQTQAITVTPSGGTYDSISYAWRVVRGGGSLNAAIGTTVIYDSGGVPDNTEVTIECVATARGSGTSALNRTVDSATQIESFVVRVIGNFDRVGTFSNFNVGETRPAAIASYNGSLYMIGQSTNSLYTLDTATGEATRVGRLGTAATESLPSGLAAHGGSLYMVGESTDSLYTLNAGTGAATTIGATIADPTGLTSHGDNLYAVNEEVRSLVGRGALYTINPATGAGTQVGSADLFGANEAFPAALASFNNTLYMVGNVTGFLYELDPMTGIATRVGTTSYRGVVGSSHGLAAHDGILYMVADISGVGSGLFVINLRLPINAPTVTLTDIDFLAEDDTFIITAEPEGGIYDSISYAWRVVSGGGSLNTTTGNTVIYDSSGVSVGTIVTIECVATARGTGIQTDADSMDSTTVRETFTISRLSRVVAPTLTITDIDFLIRGGTATFIATPAGGTYDSISYAWRVVSGGGSLNTAVGNTVIYNSDMVSNGTEVTIECVATVRGTDTTAADGSVASVTQVESFIIDFGTLILIGSSNNFGVNESFPTGLASHGGTLYMVGQSTDALHTIDPVTGAATRVGSAVQFGISETRPYGLASHSGSLYMIADLYRTGNFSLGLVTLNTTTGVATQVDQRITSIGGDMRGLASHNGNLYVIRSGAFAALYRISATTGVVTKIGTLNQFGVRERSPAAIVSHNNNLYMIGSATDSIYTLSVSTGRATRVGGSSSATQYGGLATAAGLSSHNNDLYMAASVSGRAGLYTILA